MSSQTPIANRRRRVVSGLLAGFILLLALSTYFTHREPARRQLRPQQQEMALPVFNAEGQPEGQAQIAYYAISANQTGSGTEATSTTDAATNATAPTLLLIHGTPFSSESLLPLVEELRGKANLVVPDLPGAGASELELPSYSARSQALTVLALLDKLGINKVNIASHSQGAAVALHLAELAPQRVTSLMLISPMGIQGSELLGNHALNDNLYGVQYALLWTASKLTPHFGYLDTRTINLPYARRMHETGQRELAGLLAKYEGPVLIYQGRDDVVLPPAIAQENYRTAQASELYFADGGHLNIKHDAAQLAPRLLAFAQKAQSNGNELARTLKETKKSLDDGQGVTTPMSANNTTLIILYMVLLVIATLLSEDLTCVAAGVLASRGVIGFIPAASACVIGIVIGDSFLYLLGRWLGRPALKKAPLRWFIDEREVEASSRWFHKRGIMLIISSRFLPGSRIPTYFGAGVLHMPIGKFLTYFVIAAVLWTPVIVGVGYWSGDVVIALLERYEKYAIWTMLGIILLLIVMFNTLLPLTSWKGRRALLSKWRRLTQWEYWPVWAFYPPIMLYALYKGLRKGSLTLFTAVNPAMPHSGFTQEPKSEILHGLSGAGTALPPWTHIPPATDPQERLHALNQFMQRHKLSLPIALKPNEGERGQGVAIIRSEAAALDYLSRCKASVIAQEYIGGLEYGIFYYRHPDEAHGHIFGITDKRFTSVIGDGEHNLEHLILADERTVAMQRYFRRKWAEKLDFVPAKGETFVLAEIGTHCRGSLFLDGSDLVTPELITAIDAISRQYDGFYLGRYDIKVPSIADLQAGKNIKVIELNGITAEPTFCYDPKHSVWYAWKTYLRLWKVIFDIGEANRRNGHKPSSPFAILRLILSSHTREVFEA